MTKSTSQKLGSSWVRDLITYGRGRGYTRLSPVGLAGGGFTGRDSDDIGDLDHFPDATVELKNAADSEDLSKGFKQVQAAQKNRGTTWHWYFKKYRGRSPGQAYALCTVEQAFTMSRFILVLQQMVGENSAAEALSWARGDNPAADGKGSAGA